MIRKVVENERSRILRAIGEQYGKCLYLYLDLQKYGLNNPNINIWISDDNGKIEAIILKYYRGMHIYLPENKFNTDKICWLIRNEKPTIICAERSVIETLEKQEELKNYDSEYGWVRRLDRIKQGDESGIIKNLNANEFKQLTNLLLGDIGIGGSYTFDSMYDQIIERYKDGYGRNYVLKDGDKVIAHAGTGAEDNKLGVLSYVITDPTYRKRGLALKLCTAVCHDLIKEGKKVFLINYSTESTALYDKLGFRIDSECGKLFINNER